MKKNRLLETLKQVGVRQILLLFLIVIFAVIIFNNHAYNYLPFFIAGWLWFALKDAFSFYNSKITEPVRSSREPILVLIPCVVLVSGWLYGHGNNLLGGLPWLALGFIAILIAYLGRAL